LVDNVADVVFRRQCRVQQRYDVGNPSFEQMVG
jgi:hypothetical protein